jgi:hypothetical protein
MTRILQSLLIWMMIGVLSCASPGKAGQNASSQEGIDLAMPLIQAIEHYFIENDEYPSHLRLLIPEHLLSLPWEDLAEWQFKYATQRSGQSFILAFIPEPHQRCDYTTHTRWVCKDSTE